MTCSVLLPDDHPVVYLEAVGENLVTNGTSKILLVGVPCFAAYAKSQFTLMLQTLLFTFLSVKQQAGQLMHSKVPVVMRGLLFWHPVTISGYLNARDSRVTYAGMLLMSNWADSTMQLTSKFTSTCRSGF